MDIHFLLNVVELKFVLLFGNCFFHKTFILFVLAMLTFVVFIALFAFVWKALVWVDMSQTVFWKYLQNQYFDLGYDFMETKSTR